MDIKYSGNNINSGLCCVPQNLNEVSSSLILLLPPCCFDTPHETTCNQALHAYTSSLCKLLQISFHVRFLPKTPKKTTTRQVTFNMRRSTNKPVTIDNPLTSDGLNHNYVQFTNLPTMHLTGLTQPSTHLPAIATQIWTPYSSGTLEWRRAWLQPKHKFRVYLLLKKFVGFHSLQLIKMFVDVCKVDKNQLRLQILSTKPGPVVTSHRQIPHLHNLHSTLYECTLSVQLQTRYPIHLFCFWHHVVSTNIHVNRVNHSVHIVFEILANRLCSSYFNRHSWLWAIILMCRYFKL